MRVIIAKEKNDKIRKSRYVTGKKAYNKQWTFRNLATRISIKTMQRLPFKKRGGSNMDWCFEINSLTHSSSASYFSLSITTVIIQCFFFPPPTFYLGMEGSILLFQLSASVGEGKWILKQGSGSHDIQASALWTLTTDPDKIPLVGYMQCTGISVLLIDGVKWTLPKTRTYDFILNQIQFYNPNLWLTSIFQ